MGRWPVTLTFFYWCFSAFSLGIAIQQASLILFILMGLVFSLGGVPAFSLPRVSHKRGLFFFFVIILSAILAQVTEGFRGEATIHWALIVFWALHARTVADLRWVTLHRVLVILSVPGMLYSVYWLLRPDEIAWALKVGFSMYPRAFGFVSNPITHAEGLVIIACWTVSRLSGTVVKTERRWLIAHLALSLSIILASRVRAGILGFAVLLLLDAWLTPKRRRLCLCFLAIMVVGFFSSVFIFGFNSASVKERLLLSQNSLQLFLKHPILGIGPDKFELVIPHDRNIRGVHPHNTVLGILTETGVVGLVAFLAFMWGIGRRSIQLFKSYRETGDDRRWASQALLYVFICFWIFGLFDFNFGDSELLVFHGFHWAVIARFSLPDEPPDDLT